MPETTPHETNPQPPVVAPAPVLTPPAIPESPNQPTARRSSSRRFVAVVLSLGLGLFLADALISTLDDSFILLFNNRVLSPLRGIVGFFSVLIGLLIYALMAITPMIPKRAFIPLALYSPLAALIAVPFWIYSPDRIQIVIWATSAFQVFCALTILTMVQNGFKLRLPLVSPERLNPRGFSWLNLGGFVLANAFLLLPAIVVYLFLCATMAVGHFSEGFVGLHPSGLSVQMRKYVRDDGRSVQLYPMAHVADRNFYQTISQSFPSNSTILMEGVTDTEHLLTNHISYKRMAAALGLSEQQREFKPSDEQMERADVDVKEFTTNTIGFLNLVMRIHSQGLNLPTLMELMQYSPQPGFEKELFEDLLHKRNRHLLNEVQARLPETENIVIPWGAAHMPEIAKEIQKNGFRLEESRDYTVIRFGAGKKTAIK